MSFPVGTAACVYALWFLLSGNGKRLHERSEARTPPPPARELYPHLNEAWWANERRKEEETRTPPAPPPDWR